MNKLTRQGIHCAAILITLLCFAYSTSKYRIATKGIITTGMMGLKAIQNKRQYNKVDRLFAEFWR